jgi:hypothetical protein
MIPDLAQMCSLNLQHLCIVLGDLESDFVINNLHVCFGAWSAYHSMYISGTHSARIIMAGKFMDIILHHVDENRIILGVFFICIQII